jgi:hypothetical protein
VAEIRRDAVDRSISVVKRDGVSVVERDGELLRTVARMDLGI